MKNALSRYLPIFCAIAIGTMTVRGQSPGNPAAVPIKMWATGGPISGGNGTTLLELQLSGAVPSSDFPGEFVNLSESGFSGSVTTPLATVQLIPNFLYSGELTVAYAHGSFYFAPPPGYDLLINGLPQRCWSYDAYSSKIDKSITVQLLRLDGNVPKAGVCSQIQSGMVSWQVSLGGQMNGTSAGYLSIVDSGTEATWSNVYTPGGLQYISPSTEVEPYINPTTGYLRQVLADQALVDIETISSTEYTISFYNIAQITGTVSPYTFTGQPFVQYTISQGLSGNNSLQITKITYETTSANDNPSQPALTQVTTLTRTGSGMNSYIWTLNKWNTSEQSQIAEETRTWGGQPGARTEGLVVNTPGDAAAATIGNDFATYNWGEELVSTAIGSTNTVTNSYTYYQGSNAANPGSYGFFESSISTDGSWVAYDYYNPATPTLTTGMLNHIYRPFNNSPNLVTQNTGAGDVTTLQWTIDPYGAPTRPYSELTQVNGVTTGYSQTAYTDNFTSVGIYLDGTIVTDYVTEAVTTASTDSVGTLTSTNKFFAENGIDPLVVSQPYSTIGPNGVQQSYAYLRGDFNASNYTFTADAQFGFSSSIAVITGSNNASSGGTSYSSYNGFPVDPIYLINGKSTMVVTIRDPLGLIRSTQSYAWLSGWQPTGTTNYAYDYAGNPVQITQPNGSVVTPAYNGQQMTSLTDASGIAFDYSYDYAGRVSSIAKVGGSTTNLLYDAVGRSTSKSVTNGSESISTAYTYDDAGRLTQVTPPGASAGLAAVSYSYAYSVNGTNDWTRTITYGDGGTKV